MSYEVIRADSIEALMERVNHAINFRDRMPLGGVVTELVTTREKITETQVVHSVKTVFSQALISVEMMSRMTFDLNDRLKRHQEQVNSIAAAPMMPPPLPPRPRRRRKTKKR